MTSSRLGGLTATVGVALCSIGCLGSGMSHEQVAGGAEVAPVMTQDELSEEVKGLSYVRDLDGECVAPGREGSRKLLAYMGVAAKAAEMSTEDLVAVWLAAASQNAAGISGGDKLRVISRLIYQVPASYAYLDPNSEQTLGSGPRGKKFWMESPSGDGKINYLHPLVVDEQGKICVTRLLESGGSYPRHVFLSDELEFFAETFPKRDLSVYLEKQR